MLKRELVRGIVISNICVKLHRNWIINEVARAMTKGERTNVRTYVLTYIRTGQTLYLLHNIVVRGDNDCPPFSYFPSYAPLISFYSQTFLFINCSCIYKFLPLGTKLLLLNFSPLSIMNSCDYRINPYKPPCSDKRSLPLK